MNLFHIRTLAAATMLAIATLPATAQTYYDGVRIGWDYSQQQFANEGVYARVKKLSNGRLALVYNAGKALYIRQKDASAKNWGRAVKVAQDNSGVYGYTNAEMIELQNGTLMYAWNARPVDTTNPGGPYKIMAIYSYDSGATWQDEQEIFRAGTAWNDGVWEPAMLQLPSGELQIYFANEYYMPNNSQKISMRRSYDNGKTWKVDETVCYRDNTRDGMPVPVYLQDEKGIALIIEDNGLNGTFKPVIIHTTDNWASGSVSGSSGSRWSALRSDEQLASDIYAGAPYIIQLGSGETLISTQSGEGRDEQGSENHALMQVYVGNGDAKDFIARSTPFPFPNNATPKVLWNSLCQIDDETVMAVSSITGLSTKNGVWTSTGRIMHPLRVPRMLTSEPLWEEVTSSIFIGAESQANATVKSLWDDTYLYFQFEVVDNNIVVGAVGSRPWETDGIEIYLDPQKCGSNSTELVTGLYKFLINVDNVTYSTKTSGNVWNEFAPALQYTVIRNGSAGYTIEMAIPWSELGGKPATSDFAAFFKLHNIDNTTGSNVVIHENLSGGNPDRPLTWMRCPMTTEGPTAVNTTVMEEAVAIPDMLHGGQPLIIQTGHGGRVALYEATSGRLLQQAGSVGDTCTLAVPATPGVAVVAVTLPSGQKLRRKITIL